MPLITRSRAIPQDAYDRLSEYKRCSICKECKHLDDFRPSKGGIKGVIKQCRMCYSRKRMLLGSRASAIVKGLEHTIELCDIPITDKCKYLGVKLDFRSTLERGEQQSHFAPSLDRIDNTKGYVPGNIQVISNLANNMKRDATIKQLIAFAEGVLRVHRL